MQTPFIRSVSPRDLPAIALLEAEAFPGDPWSEALLRQALTHETTIFLAAFPEGSQTDTVYVPEMTDALHTQAMTDLPASPPVAYCILRTILGEGSIDNICVADAYRRQGIARVLLTSGMKQAAERYGASVFTLEVRISNTPARGFYESLGFVNEGIRPSYYTHPREDAVIYRLQNAPV